MTEREAFIEDIRLALYASKIVAYSQGFDAIIEGAKEYNWDIKKGDIAKIWRGGCIIRAQFLNRITDAYAADQDLVVLLSAPYFTEAITASQEAWRRVVIASVQAGIPSPAFSSSLAYYDALRADRLPAALVQGQRDFFGAHTYKRVDEEGTFHTLWSGDRSEVGAEEVALAGHGHEVGQVGHQGPGGVEVVDDYHLEQQPRHRCHDLLGRADYVDGVGGVGRQCWP